MDTPPDDAPETGASAMRVGPKPSGSVSTPTTAAVPSARVEGARVEGAPGGVERRGTYFANVPFATILSTIALILATWVLYLFLKHTSRILTWMLIAAFFAVVLTPPVDWLVKHLRMRRAIAVSLVFLIGIATIGLLGYVFIKPLATQGTEFANKFPQFVEDAQDGKGQVGELVKRWGVDDWLTKNQDELRTRATEIFKPNRVLGTTVGAIGSVFTVVAAVLTIAVMTFLMLLEGRDLLLTAIKILRPHQRQRVMNVAQASAKTITGYVAGNLAISVIAGVSTFVFCTIVGVPFAGVLALWVALADLIPLVGATLGAIPTILVAFLTSTNIGIATLIFYVIYQQFENHVLQVTIMSRTVALKPIVVLASVLMGVELFGVAGALLAIPAAGIIKVIGSDIVAHRRPDIALEGRIMHQHVHLIPRVWSRRRNKR